MYLNEEYNNLKVEICFKMFNKNQQSKENMIIKYCKDFAELWPLFLFIKIFVQNAGLNNPSTKGINNASLFYMAVAFL